MSYIPLILPFLITAINMSLWLIKGSLAQIAYRNLLY
jgi:hypothetical protein